MTPRRKDHDTDRRDAHHHDRVRTRRVTRGLGLLVIALGLGFGASLLLGGSASAAASNVSSTTSTTLPATSSTTPTTVPAIGVGVSLPGTTGSSGTNPTTPATSSGGCGLLDLSCHVSSAIDDWFKSLVTSALDPVLALMGRTVLATPNVTSGEAGSLWAITAAIANSLVVLLVLIGGAIVMSHETLQTRTTAKDLAPRIVVGVIAANVSLSLVGVAIGAANALSGALLGGGVDAQNATTALQGLVN